MASPGMEGAALDAGAHEAPLQDRGPLPELTPAAAAAPPPEQPASLVVNSKESFQQGEQQAWLKGPASIPQSQVAGLPTPVVCVPLCCSVGELHGAQGPGHQGGLQGIGLGRAAPAALGRAGRGVVMPE